MKKILIILLAIIVLGATVFTFAACNQTEGDIKIVVPDGAPALAIAKLISENPTYKKVTFSYEIVAGATEISAKIINGEADFAIVPTNMAATLYNKGTDIRIISANTFGNLYMVGTQQVTDLAQLKGEVVCNIGMGGTPDLSFKYILQQKGIAYRESDEADTSGEKVSLRYVSAASELIPLLKTGKIKYGILGEPAVTQALSNVSSASRLFAIHTLWAEVTNDLSYTQSVFIGRQSAIDLDKGLVNWLSEKLDENTSWITANPADAQEAIKSAGSTITVPFTAEIITASNIRFIKAQDAKADIDAYLAAVAGFNASFVGGKLPAAEIYYK